MVEAADANEPVVSLGQAEPITPLPSFFEYSIPAKLLWCIKCHESFQKTDKIGYKEIVFRDGDDHCDICYRRLMAEKTTEWRSANPIGDLTIKNRTIFKRPIAVLNQSEPSTASCSSREASVQQGSQVVEEGPSGNKFLRSQARSMAGLIIY